MNDPIYQIRNVTKEYGSRNILQVDSLDIHQGEILALVGPSGAGKSTLLRLLNFLEAPTSGELCFFGKPFSSQDQIPLALKRRVTTVFQTPALLNRSVWANVTYGLRVRGQRDSSQLVHSTLQQVGLADLKNRRARTLSGGEAQRVALARAMVLKPEVLLLDEPTANLDPYNVKVIEENVSRINERDGTTIVLVTHNIFQARRLAHRVSLMLEGGIVETSSARAFFESPVDSRTEAFVNGEMVY